MFLICQPKLLHFVSSAVFGVSFDFVWHGQPDKSGYYELGVTTSLALLRATVSPNCATTFCPDIEKIVANIKPFLDVCRTVANSCDSLLATQTELRR